ncbi:ammonium transporter [Aestuariivirga litoralis]|uniref:ammonium transporter n=1 Tax=Aestuariivirga litoralis TaxID=2650924 RepID=UPI0018C50604|nr:ammonium transporter [Aestuariivirga litoralis]MBG1233755.1 ammonium transporter [Aestuariivirga litoralis]
MKLGRLLPAILGAGALSVATSSSAFAAASINKGDTAWMLVATALVVLMTYPGLALFYGGLVRTKNVLSVLMQVTTIFCLIAILWVAYGYSWAFTNGTGALAPFVGGFSKAFLAGVNPSTMAATFSKEVYLPEYVYIIFQMTFACITPALIVGAFAERMKFSAVILFMIIWFTFSYLPMAHMVWWWAGPDCYTLSAAAADVVKSCVGDASATDFLAKLASAGTDQAKIDEVLNAYNDAVNASNGWLFNKGAIDFAGGSVVHINAGIAGLVCCLMLGKRVGLGKESMAPHNLVTTLLGTGLLFFGWFGFNAGSNLEANGVAGLAFLNTMLGTAGAALAWSFGEFVTKKHASLLGAASGAVAGLVAITPACGWVGPMGAIFIGLAAGFVCLFAVIWLKPLFGYDDALDVFGVHGIGGILGALLTGIFVNPALNGTGTTNYLAVDTSTKAFDYIFSAQMYAQVVDVLTAIILSAVVSFIACLICKYTVGLRVDEQSEREGLDISSHGERAFN